MIENIWFKTCYKNKWFGFGFSKEQASILLLANHMEYDGCIEIPVNLGELLFLADALEEAGHAIKQKATFNLVYSILCGDEIGIAVLPDNDAIDIYSFSSKEGLREFEAFLSCQTAESFVSAARFFAKHYQTSNGAKPTEA